jgi:hypothetical protein
MTRIAKHLKRQWLGVVAVALVMGGGAAQVLAHGGDRESIHACVFAGGSETSPNVRIYENPNQACPADVSARNVDWAIQGPEGPAGPQGASGPQGPPGEGDGGGADGSASHLDLPANFDNATKKPNEATAIKLEKLDKPGNDAYAGSHDGPKKITTNAVNSVLLPVSRLEVPAGSYVIVAKARMHFSAVSPPFTQKITNLAECGLQSGDDSDRAAELIVNQPATAFRPAPFTMTTLHKFSVAGRIEVRCYAGEEGAYLTGLRVTAIQVNHVYDKKLP